MRVAGPFKRLLRPGRERVVGIEIVEEDDTEVVVVDLALRARRAMLCSGCARRVRVAYDRRVVSWRARSAARQDGLGVIPVLHASCPGTLLAQWLSPYSTRPSAGIAMGIRASPQRVPASTIPSAGNPKPQERPWDRLGGGTLGLVERPSAAQ